jgi:hypothetical protein
VGITGNYAELINRYYGFMGLFGQFVNLVLVAGTCDAFSIESCRSANTYTIDYLKRKTTLWLGCSILTVILA